VTGSRTLYYPYGEQRWSASGGTLPTDYTFTGQRADAGIGLMDYNARFYDAALGRFVQADTIIPSPGDPQSLNRYSYVLNSPLNYRDPSGHAYDAGGAWAGRRDTPPPPPHGPGRHVPEQWERYEEYLGLAATTCDTLALATGLIGVIGESAGLLAGVVGEPSTPVAGEVVGVRLATEAYYKAVNPIENKVSSWGAAFAALGDVAGGRTYPDWENSELVIGQDTIVAYGALALGNQNILPLEGVGDTLINGVLVAYDLGRVGGSIPTEAENRMGFSADRGGFYMDIVVYGTLAERFERAPGDRRELIHNLSPGQGWMTQ
jgi:RHS repeat-associated protein